MFQQWRLFPYIAATYAMDNFTKTFHKLFAEFRMEMLDATDKDRVVRIIVLYRFIRIIK